MNIDEYYDDSYEEEYEKPKKKINKRNPKGPYKFQITFKGVMYNVTIENVTHNKFKTSATLEDVESDFDVQRNISVLEKYLQAEGFYVAATKWNLYYK
jgi:hypothetical protein